MKFVCTKQDCTDLEKNVEFRGRIIRTALFFHSIRFLSHWVFPDKVFNEAVQPKRITRQIVHKVGGVHPRGSVINNWLLWMFHLPTQCHCINSHTFMDIQSLVNIYLFCIYMCNLSIVRKMVEKMNKKSSQFTYCFLLFLLFPLF